jgi:hypothetical protein
VVVPKDECRSEIVRNASFELKDGILTNYKAESNAKCFPESLADYKGPKDHFGYFRIGLNPSEKVMEESDARYWPQFAAGIAWVDYLARILVVSQTSKLCMAQVVDLRFILHLFMA